MTYGPFTLKSYPCPLCGTATNRILERKSGRAVPVEFTIVACTACGHVRVDPRIADENLDELYDDAYYRGNGFDATIDYDAPPTPSTLSENADIIESIARAAGGSVRGLRWLDIGCGTGTLLEQARERGADVFGFDSSRYALDSCEKKGLSLVSRADLDTGAGAFDVVSAIEVIEHVPDPLTFLISLKAHVRSGGVIFVRTGNWNLVRRLPGTPYLMPEGHIGYFTPSVMRRLFAQAGLRESPAFNRTWFVWRLLPQSVRDVVPAPIFGLLGIASRRLAPGLSPFPIGLR